MPLFYKFYKVTEFLMFFFIYFKVNEYQYYTSAWTVLL